MENKTYNAPQMTVQQQEPISFLSLSDENWTKNY